jgi:hypothetical protein
MSARIGPLPATDVPLGIAPLRRAFEASCLVRCTDVGRLASRAPRGRQVRLERTASPALAEFNHEQAARRLVELLARTGHHASHRTHDGGVRRRFTVHQVLIDGGERAAVYRTLSAGWTQGRRAMLDTAPVGASSPHNERRADLGRRAWRAALLAGGSRLRGDVLGVRLGNQEMAAVLVRAARLLDVTAVVLPRPGCLLVTVSALEDRIMRLGSLETSNLENA